VKLGETHTIRWIKSGLVVRVRYLSDSKPEETVYFYPIAANATWKSSKFLIGKHVKYDNVWGHYRLDPLDFPNANEYQLIVHLKEGGATHAIKSFTREIPKPKLRKGSIVEWRRGKWMKHLVREGWQTI